MLSGRISSLKRPASCAAAAFCCDASASASCFSRRDAVLLRDVLGRRAHVVLVVDVPQAVGDHRVDQLPVAHAVALARVQQHVRRGAHVLLAAGDDDLGVAAAHRLRRQHHGLQARAADLVDGAGPAPPCGRPALMTVWRAGFWPEPAASTWPMITSEIASPGTPALASRPLIDMRAEVRRGGLGERAAELADRGALRGHDHDVVGHASLLWVANEGMKAGPSTGGVERAAGRASRRHGTLNAA